MTNDEIRRFREEVSGDEEIETTFRRFRQEGHSRLESVRLLLDVLDVSLAEAKRLLASNDTWHQARSAAGRETGFGGDRDADDDPIPPAPA